MYSAIESKSTQRSVKSVCVLTSLSLLQNGLPFPSKHVPTSSFLQQAHREHLGYRQVKETGDDQEDDCGGE